MCGGISSGGASTRYATAFARWLQPKEEGGWGWDIVRVAAIADHSNSEFTRRRYVGATSDVIETTAIIMDEHDWSAYEL